MGHAFVAPFAVNALITTISPALESRLNVIGKVAVVPFTAIPSSTILSNGFASASSVHAPS